MVPERTPSPGEDGETIPAIEETAAARLQDLVGSPVRGSDGAVAGRVRDVYVHDAAGGLAAVTVMRRQFSSRSVLIPAAAIAELPRLGTDPEHGPGSSAGVGIDADHGHHSEEPAVEGEGQPRRRGAGGKRQRTEAAVRLRVTAEAVRAGLPAPETDHADPDLLREAAEVLGLE